MFENLYKDNLKEKKSSLGNAFLLKRNSSLLLLWRTRSDFAILPFSDTFLCQVRHFKAFLLMSISHSFTFL